MKPTCQNGSSLTIHEALTFGYVIHLNCEPKALLLSTRSAPVRYSRSFTPRSSCASPPIVVLTVSPCVDGSAVAVPETVVIDGPGKPIPPRKLSFRDVRYHCPPRDVDAVNDDVSFALAVAL